VGAVALKSYRINEWERYKKNCIYWLIGFLMIFSSTKYGFHEKAPVL
jgi:hypothetical protein